MKNYYVVSGLHGGSTVVCMVAQHACMFPSIRAGWWLACIFFIVTYLKEGKKKKGELSAQEKLHEIAVKL